MKRIFWLSMVLCLVSLISLISLISPKSLFASTTVRFLYDGDGNRVAKIESGKTTLYVGDTEKNITTGEVTRYYSIGGKRVAVKDNSGTNYIISEHLGSLRSLTDSTGNPKSDIRYYPYGSVRAKTGTIIVSRQYTSQINDDITGLYFYSARYYNPDTGNFIQADRAEGPNRYIYVNGNPIIKIDPSGKCESAPSPYNDDLDPSATTFWCDLNEAYGGPLFWMSGGAQWSTEEINSIRYYLDKLSPELYRGHHLKIIKTTAESKYSNFNNLLEAIDMVFANLLGGADAWAYPSSGEIDMRAGALRRKDDVFIHELAHANYFLWGENWPDASDPVGQKVRGTKAEGEWWWGGVNSTLMNEFLQLRDWSFNTKSGKWENPNEGWVSKHISKDYNFRNPHEDFAVLATDYYRNSVSFQKRYGPDLNEFFKRYYMGSTFQ